MIADLYDTNCLQHFWFGVKNSWKTTSVNKPELKISFILPINPWLAGYQESQHRSLGWAKIWVLRSKTHPFPHLTFQSHGRSYSTRFQGLNCNPIKRILGRCGCVGGETRQLEAAYPRQQSRRRQRTYPYGPQWMPLVQEKLKKIELLMAFLQQQPQRIYNHPLVPRHPQMYRLQVLRQPQERCSPHQVFNQPQMNSHHLMVRIPQTYQQRR